ncbi:YkvA family protein [Devosia rhodophyticola]|uniref:YkvA family protein n=1 Tax=Devosia rhodophyticola TaxID=3026423 RepID=A0ABY7YU76_9HYPH|nr:YkvA family protein [Devosia rhodophyticola]WDR04600.1 YkvA family protein [Devosia rhodophyticola]
MMKNLGRSAFARIILFRKEVVTLYHAFLDPLTPAYLKFSMIGVLFYLLSPIDLVPDFIPVLGWIDDALLVPMMVSWIVSRLPVKATVNATYRHRR